MGKAGYEGTTLTSLLIILLKPYAGVLFLSVLSVPLFATVLYITG